MIFKHRNLEITTQLKFSSQNKATKQSNNNYTDQRVSAMKHKGENLQRSSSRNKTLSFFIITNNRGRKGKAERRKHSKIRRELEGLKNEKKRGVKSMNES